LYHIVTPHSIEGMVLRSQIGTSIGNYIANIPSMSAFEIGNDIGFGLEKGFETVFVTRGTSLFVNAVRVTTTARSVNITRAVGAAPRGFSKTINFGKIKVSSEIFHRQIKPSILNSSGNFSRIVGRNPDIKIVNGRIRLTGNGPFKGKSFNTGLDASDFFE